MPVYASKTATCAVPDCETGAYGHGYCSKHYQRWRRHGDPLIRKCGGNPPRPISERLWPKVDQSGGPDACWPFMGGRDRDGYGRFWIGDDTKPAHRAAYIAEYGPIPKGMAVCHRCDNPPCCNPAHLFLGMIADNNADMHSKERGATGEHHGMHRLKAKDVREMRSRFSSGESRSSLAESFGISLTHTCRIITHEAWASLS